MSHDRDIAVIVNSPGIKIDCTSIYIVAKNWGWPGRDGKFTTGTPLVTNTLWPETGLEAEPSI